MKIRNSRTAISAFSSAVALALAVRGTLADPSVSYTGGTYTQDFNSLATYSADSGLWANNNPSPPVSIESVGILPVVIGSSPATPGGAFPPIDLTGASPDFFNTISNISLMNGWYANNFGGNSTNLKYDVSSGINTSATGNATAALYAFFDPNAQGAGNNLALGAVSASETGNIVFGVKLINTTGGDLNAISLSATGQLFHQDTGAKSLKFGYSIASPTSSIPNSGLSLFGGLNVGGFPVGTAPSEVVQSAASTQNLAVVDLPLSSTWHAGDALWLTWQMGTGGSGQGLSIDDLSFSSRLIAPAGTLAWNLPGGGAWDTVATNWSGVSTTFANGTYNVSFGTITADANIVVQAGGITLPQSLTISNNNTAAAYTFSGGAIGGGFGAGVTLSGTGTVKFTSPNTYGLATNLNAGTLIVDNDNELGNDSIGIVGALLNINGGALKLAGALNATHRPLTVSAAGGTINTNGFNAAFAGDSINAVTIRGALHVTGGGDLNLGAQPAFGTAALPAGKLIIDAGNTVTILGNSRSSPSDMYDGGVFNGNLILKSTPLGARFNFDSPGASGNTDHNGDSKITGTGEIQVLNGSGWVDTGTNGIHSWNFDSNGVVISNTSATYAAEIDVGIHLNPLADSDPVGHPFTRLDVTTANFIGAANPNPTNAFGTVIGGTKNGTQGHGPKFSNILIKGVISGHSDINIGNDYKSGGSGDLTLMTHNTYDGVTLINGGGGLYFGIADALPVTTDVVFGAFAGAGASSMDLSGFDQHVRSIEVGLGTNSPQSNVIFNSGNADATLYVTGDITPFYPYNAQLRDGGTTTLGTVGTHKLALAKSGAGTLVLGQYNSSLSKTTSNYSGGTTVSGGTLRISFDGSMGVAGGSLTLDGGTVGVTDPYLLYNNSTTHETSVTWNSSRPFTVTANGGTINTPTFTAFQGNTPHDLVASVAFTGDGGYRWNGPLELTGDAGSNFSFNGGAGTVSVTPGALIHIGPNVTFTSGGGDLFTDSVNAGRHVAIVNDSTFIVNNAAAAVAGITGTGDTTVAIGASLISDGVQGNSLTINGTQQIRSNGSANGVSKVASLSINGAPDAWTGELDLTNNLLVVQTTGATGNKATTLSTLLNQVANGTTGSAGIVSTTLIASKTALAVVDNGSYITPKTTLRGTALDSNSLLVVQALIGDTNLDGSVNLSDLGTLLQNYVAPNRTWNTGHFTTGNNFADLGALLQNYGQVTTGFALLPDAPGGLGELGTTAPVPEPASLAVLALGGAALLARRRRNFSSTQSRISCV